MMADAVKANPKAAAKAGAGPPVPPEPKTKDITKEQLDVFMKTQITAKALEDVLVKFVANRTTWTTFGLGKKKVEKGQTLQGFPLQVLSASTVWPNMCRVLVKYFNEQAKKLLPEKPLFFNRISIECNPPRGVPNMDVRYVSAKFHQIICSFGKQTNPIGCEYWSDLESLGLGNAKATPTWHQAILIDPRAAGVFSTPLARRDDVATGADVCIAVTASCVFENHEELPESLRKTMSSLGFPIWSKTMKPSLADLPEALGSKDVRIRIGIGKLRSAMRKAAAEANPAGPSKRGYCENCVCEMCKQKREKASKKQKTSH